MDFLKITLNYIEMKAKELTVTKVKNSTSANGNASIPDTKEIFTSDSNGQVILEGLVAIKMEISLFGFLITGQV